MMSQPGKRIIVIHIIPNIPRSKAKQKMKFCQLIKYKNRNIFLQNHPENEAGRLVSDLFLFYTSFL